MTKILPVTYKITESPHLLDEQFEITDHIRWEIERAFNDIQKRKPGYVDKLRNLIAKYPQVPQFKNYLYAYYSWNENKAKKEEALYLLVNEHPDYLYTKLALIEMYLAQKEFKKIAEMIGKNPDIAAWYPQRTVFHYKEVKHFESLVISYYIQIKNLTKAEYHLEKLKRLDVFDEEIENLQLKVMYARLETGMKRMLKEHKEARTVKSIASTAVEQTDQEPVFNHELIYKLYGQGMDIDHELIRQILLLPRKSLINDLNKVIIDCIARYEYFVNETEYSEETHTFPFHAMFLITELKAEESLPVILELLRQDSELTEYWFFDTLNEFIWECLYITGRNKLNDLAEFLKEPDRYCFHRSEVSKAISQSVLYQPQLRMEVINLYREILSYYIEHHDDDRLIDTDFIGMIVGDIMDIEGRELIPEISEIYDKKLANPGVSGTLKSVLRDLSQLQLSDQKNKLYDIYSRYAEILTWWNKNDTVVASSGEEEDDFNENDKHIPIVNAQPKVGRNDPCPCGSGKKFKKCCIDKLEY